jgi:endonuclease G
VAVPSGFFKVVVDPKTKESQAFLLPHGRIPSADLPLYETSIREVERKTGLNFLPALSESEQDRIESAVSNLWPANLAVWAKERSAVCPSDKN